MSNWSEEFLNYGHLLRTTLLYGHCDFIVFIVAVNLNYQMDFL